MNLTEWEAWCYLAMVWEDWAVAPAYCSSGVCWSISILFTAGFITAETDLAIRRRMLRYRPGRRWFGLYWWPFGDRPQRAAFCWAMAAECELHGVA